MTRKEIEAKAYQELIESINQGGEFPDVFASVVIKYALRPSESQRIKERYDRGE